MNSNNMSIDTKAYFLEQGKSIVKSYTILNSNLFMHHLRKWTSVLFEISLYVIFLFILIFAFLYPSLMTQSVLQCTRIPFEAWHSEIYPVFIVTSIIIAATAIPVILLAIFLGRNRKKNNLIREAFTEVTKIKKEFDEAAKDLQL